MTTVSLKFAKALRTQNLTSGYTPLTQTLCHRRHLCDDFFYKIVMNSKDKLHELLPYIHSKVSSLRNKRMFTIPRCKTDRFKNSYIAAAVRYNTSCNF